MLAFYSRGNLGRLAGGLLAASMMFSVSAPSLAQVEAVAPSTGSGTGSAWIKACEKEQATEKDVCIVTQELRDQNGKFVVSAGVRSYPDDPKKLAMIFGLPLGMLLQPGIRYQIDQGAQTSGQFGICLPTGCFAEVEIDEGVIASLKKGSELVVLAISGRGQTVPFRLSLIGFTKTFDGEPIDPQVLAETQKKLQEEIQRRAEERRKKLLEQQQSSGGDTPAAPAQ